METAAQFNGTGPGVKLDTGKQQPLLIHRDMSRALSAVADVATFGARKYTPGGWATVPNAGYRYENARIRHASARHSDQLVDEESKLLHLAHEAWNSLAMLELYLRENPQ